MKSVKLEGALLDNGEFMCMGKVIQLSDEEIEMFIEVLE